ncbi:hypothetical protein [Metapseudomonas otitidis]|uniref:Uncharacterized protein n=1 Tax=Metapseudomonas otitidis TaxID=319939 RepID=A0A679GEX6_9GAMM|nr:hypothetical protein [Pseudomonas otitidis]BCA28665.1 hypothetical protein PtoMrB4_26420 [Pseudomonas otitidis]
MPAQQLFETIRDELLNGAIIDGDNYQADIEILQPLVDGFSPDLPVRLVSYQNHNGANDITKAVEDEVPYILGVRVRSTDRQGTLMKNAYPYLQGKYSEVFNDTVDTIVRSPDGSNFRADIALYRRR